MTAPPGELPILVTLGDVAGIGPEIVAQAALAGDMKDAWVVGDRAVMQAAVARIGAPLPRIVEPDATPPGLAALPQGRVHALAGQAAALWVTYAAREALAGRARAVVTAPLSKEGLSAAGLAWPGHTELLQSLAQEHLGHRVPVRMMLANPELRTVLVSIHVSLRDAIDAVSCDRVLETIVIADKALRIAGLTHPRIAVAGLNPHAGEAGRFGREEIEHIAPAVEVARKQGIDASGPFPPDTVFMRARRGAFDVVVAMTHDHGLIPVKYLGVEQGVNVTLGLPFVRTSPDHGTAYDIAGQGVADASSLRAALAQARAMARQAGLGA